MNLNQQCGIILIRNLVSHQHAAAPPLLPCLVGEQVFNASVDTFQLRILDQMAKREGSEVIDTLPRFEYCSRETSLDRADFPVEADDHGGLTRKVLASVIISQILPPLNVAVTTRHK